MLNYGTHIGNCFDLMPEIDDKSIDLILTDLPYGVTEASWDKQLPLNKLWEQYNRILTDKGTCVFTATQPFTTQLITSNMKLFKYCLVWEKTVATGWFHARNKPMKLHEDIVIFSKGVANHANISPNRMTYNPQMTVGKPYHNKNISSRESRGIMWGFTKKEYTSAPNVGTRFPNSIIRIPSIKGAHPTAKPVELLEYLVRTYSNEGDTVLDNCAGSGSTGIACNNTNRNYIGIELNPIFITQKFSPQIP